MSRITVAIVAICGASHLRRCLDALAAQRDAPAFEVVVVSDPRLEEVAEEVAERPGARWVAHRGLQSPLELASRAIAESRGELVLLTEDHCVPAPDWVHNLCAAERPERAAVGGVVDAEGRLPAVDWAFYFVDFFRYASPAQSGPSPSLTVCNVAYRRSRLEAVRSLWQGGFHETAVHRALRKKFGELWLAADARVTMRRQVRLFDALSERYAFGRLFACTRLDYAPPAMRWVYGLLAPGLPLLLLARMARRALPSRRLRPPFFRSLGALLLMVLWWSWGEWLGYLTRRRPASLAVAPETPKPGRSS